jgi:hypothetical protein
MQVEELNTTTRNVKVAKYFLKILKSPFCVYNDVDAVKTGRVK